ncbi:unnamed protein product [Porites lobata]|uniref:Uncharacterized protein n=1 Tax=Porites lobata TaxID=104759 RepID=A0ABN8PYE8_9CNID|nr:unnamed protein product [Porites lobata]
MYMSNKKCVIGTMNRRVRAKRIYADMQRNARYSEVLPADQHGNSLIVQSPGGAQYSRNTSHVKKLLENGDTHVDAPSIPEVVVTGQPHKQNKLTPQQSVVIPEPNVVEP